MKHTPEPWEVKELTHVHDGIDIQTFSVSAGGQVIAVVGGADRHHNDVHKANAHLIKAAPRMHKALKRTLLFVYYNPRVQDLVPEALIKLIEQALQHAKPE
jgi:hypothetical protein